MSINESAEPTPERLYQWEDVASLEMARLCEQRKHSLASLQMVVQIGACGEVTE